MVVTLTDYQKQVDAMIDARITRIARAEYNKANRLPNGRLRKKYKPYTLPQEVSELLELRQDLYKGVDPESICATITNGDIQHLFLNS